MRVKERMLMLKLMEREKECSEFLKELGVSVEWKTDTKQVENKNKNVQNQGGME